jgi:asparagine synthase (glutamine-hydrolysing)
MCGIAGLVLTSAARVDGKLARGLLDDLEHRGPDDAGLLALRGRQVSLHREAAEDFVANAILVHRRLSIIDLSPAGWQPMRSPDGRYFIIFNGEIYNYLELRAELSALGYRFRSDSDTEVLLAAYAEWGAKALHRLTGMFAFAILDVEQQKIFIARDFFGIKPLYYGRWRDGFVFASEINAILRLPGVSRRINPQRLYDYLRFGVTDYGGETLFDAVRQLPAAHYLEVWLEDARVSAPVRYWQVDPNERIDLSFDQAAYRLRDLFLESVSLHLRSDVAVGAALSGGIDSSSIVAAMRHVAPRQTIHAFSYIADDPAVSEERWVDLIGETVNLVVHKARPQPAELVSDLESLVALQGECFVSTSIYAQRRVFQLAGEAGIKVMLDGQGADEMLAGYQTYIAARLVSLVRQGRLGEAARFVWRARRSHGPRNWRLWLRALDFVMPPKVQAPLRRWIGEDLMSPWLNAKWFQDRDVTSASLNYGKGTDVLKQTLVRTLSDVSLPALLRYEDRNSMASSIESRVPFLTPALASFVLALPEEYIISADGTTKAVFRKAMRGIVPDAVLDRSDKIGFVTPENRWLVALRPWVERQLSSRTALEFSPINARRMVSEWSDIVAGRRRFDSRVWRWLNTILWVEKFAMEAD